MIHPPRPEQVTMKLVGVGSAGGRIMSHRAGVPLQGLGVILLDTDEQALRGAQASVRLVLGDTVTRGLGAGGNPDVGRCAAEATADAARTILAGADMVVIAAGLGGGTGTGAAPVVAQIARDLGILTVGMVTLPFSFEGARRRRIASDSMDVLVETVDTLIVVPNDRLLQTGEMKMSMRDAFARADAVLQQGILRITDSIRRPGRRPLEFSALRRFLAAAGAGRLATARARGPQRGRVAVLHASTSPLLDESLARARRILVIVAAHNVTSHDMEEIAVAIPTVASPTATIAISAVDDPDVRDELEVTLIACALDDPSGGHGGPQHGPDTGSPAPQPSPLHPSGPKEPLISARRLPLSDVGRAR